MKLISYVLLAASIAFVPLNAHAQSPREVFDWIFSISIVKPTHIEIIYETTEAWNQYILEGQMPATVLAFTENEPTTRNEFIVHIGPDPDSRTLAVWVHEALHFIHSRMGTDKNTQEQLFHTEAIVIDNTSAIICNSQAIRLQFPEPTVPVHPSNVACNEMGFLAPIH